LGTTLFHLLVYYNFDGKFSDFISYLVLAKNVDVDIVNAQGYTALQKLLEGDFVIDCAMQLVLLGADIEKSSSNGRTLVAVLHHQNDLNGKNDSLLLFLKNLSHIKNISDNFYSKININQNNIVFFNRIRKDNLVFKPILLKQIFAKIETSQSLIELKLSEIKLDSLQVSWLIQAIAHSSLRTLTLTKVAMSEKDAKLLAQSLTANTHLRSFSYCGSKLSTECGIAFAAALKKNQYLQILNLANNSFNSICMEEISRLCASNIYLQQINLDGNSLNENDLKQILTMCKANPQLKISCENNADLTDGVYLTCKNGRIEVIKKISISEDGKKEKFEHEVRLMHELVKHPHVVNIRQSYMDDSFGYIIMKYFPATLRHYIEDNTIPHHWGIKTTLMHQIASGLGYVHVKKIIHCDIKPENIFMTSIGIPKIADFGESTKRAKYCNGTPGYRAPEVEMKVAFNSFKSDIYSYGVVCREIAITSSDEDMQNVPQPTFPKDCPENLNNIINKCLREDREKRPPITKVLDEFKTMSQENFRNLLNQCQKNVPLNGVIVDQIMLLGGLENIDAQNDDGETFLHLLSYQNQTGRYDKFIARLVKNGASLNAQNRDHLTPYQVLISQLSFNFYSALHYIQLGANSTLRNSNGQPLLHLLAENNQANLIITLFQKSNYNIDTFNNNGETALQYIMNKKFINKEIAMLLISLGADSTVKSNNGLTLSEMLLASGIEVSFLKHYSLFPPASLQISSISNHLDVNVSRQNQNF